MMDIDTIVLFGASGDLARKMLFPALYRLEERSALDQQIVGIALDDWSNDHFAGHVDDAVVSALPDSDPMIRRRLERRLAYVAGDYTRSDTFERLAAATGAGSSRLHYLAIPPSFFEQVAGGLSKVGLLDPGRLLVEKPFGRDLASARRLNEILHRYMDESEIYRIDHFLGKEAVENLLTFRYANPVIDAVWNRHYIHRVDITMSEDFGVDGRGALYDSLGVVRDVVENHLFQVLLLLTMEAPVAATADAYADERARVLRAIRTLTQAEVRYGQYDGYRSVGHVAPDSTTPTYISFEASIDTPRWYGVPFSITAGKELDVTETTAEVVFCASPPLMFSRTKPEPPANRLVFRIGPSDGVDFVLQTKQPGNGVTLATTPLSVDFEQVFGRIPLAYERVLEDALAGDRSQFARQDAVEEGWRIVDEITDPADAPPIYAAGSRGPVASA